MQWLAAHRVGVWAFLVTVAYVPGIMSAAIVPRWAVIALGIPLVSQIRWQIPASLQIAIAAGVAWTAATIIQAPDRADSLLQFFFLLCLLGAMGVASQLDSLDQALAGLCWGVAVSAAFCIATAVTGHHFVAYHHIELKPGLFYNSEVLCELAAPLVVWAAVKRQWHFVAICLIPIALNTSRIAVVAVAVGMVVAFWPSTWRARAALVGVALLLVGAVIAYFSMFNFKIGSVGLRIVGWLTALYAITPAGQGFGWYRATHAGEEFAHSDVLQAFAEIGLGALFFALIPIYALWNRSRDHAERAAFVVVMVEVVASFPLHVPATGFLAALLAGYLVRDRLGVRSDEHGGRDQAGDRHGRPRAQGFAAAWGGRNRGILVSPRSTPALISALGEGRGGAEGAR